MCMKVGVLTGYFMAGWCWNFIWSKWVWKGRSIGPFGRSSNSVWSKGCNRKRWFGTLWFVSFCFSWLARVHSSVL